MVAQRGQVRLLVRKEALASPAFTVADIVRRTGLQEASVRTELTRLKRLGLLESEPLAHESGRRGAPIHLYRLVPGAAVRAVLLHSIANFAADTSPVLCASPRELLPCIKVVGIGGAGVRTLENLRRQTDLPIELIAVGTQARSILLSSADRKIVLGAGRSRGFGAGGDPSVAQRAALEMEESLRQALAGSDMVFLVAGLGGGTGSGAAPYLAGMARTLGALTVGVVTEPFDFEGRRRQAIATQGRDLLLRQCDALICLPNDRLLERVSETAPVAHAFDLADRFLTAGVLDVAALILRPGLLPLDLDDLEMALRTCGPAILSTGSAAGPGRAQAAWGLARAEWEAQCGGCEPEVLIVCVSGPTDLSLHEVRTVAEAAGRLAPPDVHLLVGAQTLAAGETLRVTLLAGQLRLSRCQPDREGPVAPAFLHAS